MNDATVIADYVVSATPIAGTDEVLLQAWEPEAGHSTLRWHDNRYLGKVGTAPWARRAADARAAIQADKDRAYEIILDHEPKAIRGRRAGAQVYVKREDLS